MAKAMTRDRVERAARVYNTNIAASKALGINPDWFGHLCRKWGIETPHARKCARS